MYKNILSQAIYNKYWYAELNKIKKSCKPITFEHFYLIILAFKVKMFKN